MRRAGPAVALEHRMTRSFGASRPSKRAPALARRHQAIEPRSFTCYRLVPIYDPEPGEPAFASIELMQTSNAMGAFMRLR